MKKAVMFCATLAAGMACAATMPVIASSQVRSNDPTSSHRDYYCPPSGADYGDVVDFRLVITLSNNE